MSRVVFGLDYTLNLDSSCFLSRNLRNRYTITPTEKNGYTKGTTNLRLTGDVVVAVIEDVVATDEVTVLVKVVYTVEVRAPSAVLVVVNRVVREVELVIVVKTVEVTVEGT